MVVFSKFLQADFFSNALTLYFFQTMLSSYQTDKNNCWKNKVAAIYLVTTFSTKGKVEIFGATQVSELVNLTTFFENHVAPELKDPAGKYPSTHFG